MLSTALQLYSVRDDLAVDFEGTLKKVKAMGYQGVEFAGLYDHSVDEIKALMKKYDLIPMSAHVAYAEMMKNPEQVMNDYAAIGCKYIAIPYLEESCRCGTNEFPKVLEDIKMLGRAAKEKHMQLLYHNHDFEFAKFDGKYALDILYDTIPSDLLQTEIDTCWVHVAGENPAKYVLNYSGRSPVVHLKDFMMPGKKPTRMYKLIGLDEEDKQDEGGAFEFRPVGYGAQDIPSIIEAAKKAGSAWLVVEQDNPSMGKPPMECAQMSMEYLKTLNY